MLARINGALVLRDMPGVAAVDGFTSLTDVGALVVEGDASPASLAGLPALERANVVRIADTTRLEDVALPSLHTASSVEVARTRNLGTLNGLSALAIVGEISIADNV